MRIHEIDPLPLLHPSPSTLLRRVRCDFISSFEPTHALTFTWNDSAVSLDRIRTVLRHLHASVDRRLLGTRFNTVHASRRTAFVAVVELLGTHPHVHVAWRVSGEFHGQFETMFFGRRPTIWCRLAPAGDCLIEGIGAAQGWIAYMTKALDADDADGHMILSSEFLPN